MRDGLWTQEKKDLYIVWNYLDRLIREHNHTRRKTCAYCDSLDSVIVAILRHTIEVLSASKETL